MSSLASPVSALKTPPADNSDEPTIMAQPDNNTHQSWILLPRTTPDHKWLTIGGKLYEAGRTYSKDELRRLVEILEGEIHGKELYQYERDDPGVVIQAMDYEDALLLSVHAISESDPGHPRLVFYTDGSSKGEISGMGITYKRMYGADNDWVDAAYGLPGIKGSFEAEVLAIHRALWSAYYELSWLGRTPNQRLPTVMIFSDCLGAINLYYQLYWSCHVRPNPLPANFEERTLEPLQRLRGLGSKIQINWTPGHVGVAGNTRADILANIRRGYISQVSPTVNAGPGPSILPLSDPSSSKDLAMMNQIHLGRPAIDSVYWRKQEVAKYIKKLVEENLNRDNLSAKTRAKLRAKELPEAPGTSKKRRKRMRSGDISLPSTKRPKLDSSPILSKPDDHTEQRPCLPGATCIYQPM
ncbi:hypothetical protein GGR54DRAFT_639571 [Hypoxylon sp. NC1633]|nr:hypothetical protein GGR54DRAFT_639571 [Hypoxylon sp. NC1633]